MNQYLPEISVEELATRLLDLPNDEIQLIDVREIQEVNIACIKGFQVLPLSQYQEWSSKIAELFDPKKETMVLCHHGRRSAQMCYWLLQQGFTNVINIRGGIDAYSRLVDPTIPIY